MVQAAVKKSQTPVKAKASSKKPAAATMKSTIHPATSEMVNAAVGALRERKGASLQAIKKYIAGNYIVDIERLSPFIRKYLKAAIEKNILVQTSGVGASGRFKLAKAEKKSTTKLASEKKAKKTTKSDAAKKSEKPKSQSKAKKSGKAPAAKTKSPKAKSIRN